MPELGRRDLFKTAGIVGGASILTSYGPPAAARGIEVQTTTVFERFEGDYHTFRVPKPVRTKSGTLLAFAVGKVDDPADFSQSDLVLKRSVDGGRTWGEIEVVASDPPHRVGGTPVVDLRTGRILVIAVRIVLDAPPDTLPPAFVLHSDDEGRTWSEWTEITDQVTLPEWEHYVIGPPHGIQLRHGPHAGRLIFPSWFRVSPAQDGDPAVAGAHLTYSDDGGQTWQIGAAGQSDGRVNPGESAVVELGDGTVYVNTRDQRGTAPGHRAATTSSDGGETFDGPFEIVPDLVTPIVSASLLEATRQSDDSERIVFCSEDHPSSRDRLMLWSSLDGAKSWHKSLLVYDGPAGYTDMVDVEDNVLGVMAETGPRAGGDGGQSYHQWLTFSRVPLPVLDRPLPPRVITPDASGYGNHGLVSGSPGIVRGHRKQAFELAGDYVEVPLNEALAVGTGAFTVAMWFRSSAERLQILANAYNYQAYPKWAIDLTTSRVRAELRTDAASTKIDKAGSYVDGQWHHVALRWGGSNVVTLYVDGESEAATDPVPGSVSAGAIAPIRIGARLDGINRPLIGAVDDFVFYNRGLPGSAIAALAAGNPPRSGDDHLLIHLELDNRRS